MFRAGGYRFLVDADFFLEAVFFAAAFFPAAFFFAPGALRCCDADLRV